MQDTPEPQPTAPGRFQLHEIFAGADGLRAGWGLLLFVFFWAVFKTLLYPLVLSGLPAGHHGGQGLHAGHIIPLEITGLLGVLVAMWIMARVEGRSLAEYGLRDRRALRNFAVGAVCGAVLLSCLALCLRASGALVFDGRQLFGWTALRYFGVWLCGFFVVGALEELLFRGYAQFTIARGIRGMCRRVGAAHANAIGFWTAALLTSSYFGFGHGGNPGESPIGLISAGLIGLVFCLSIWRSGSVWWAIGFHMAWDWAESFLYGVSDSGSMIHGHLLATHPAGQDLLSGGSTGPEGSVLVFPVIALAACAAVVTLRRREVPTASAPYAEETVQTAAAPSLH